MDLTGWASPFLLVPEATCVDTPTRNLLEDADEKDLYVSDVSPLQIPFNNVRKTGSEIWTCSLAEAGKPGSACPKQFLLSNTEFSKKPICLASRRYQKKKLEEIDSMDLSASEKQKLSAKVVEKTCICEHLGNGALVALGMANERSAPPLICPGPNIAWFNKTYTLKEMVDHIYGRGPSLVSSERPHMFAKEIAMYVDHFEKLVARCTGTSQELKTLEGFKNNLEEGMDFCLAIAQKRPYEGENLESIPSCVERQRERLGIIWEDLEKKVGSSTQKNAESTFYQGSRSPRKNAAWFRRGLPDLILRQQPFEAHGMMSFTSFPPQDKKIPPLSNDIHAMEHKALLAFLKCFPYISSFGCGLVIRNFQRFLSALAPLFF